METTVITKSDFLADNILNSKGKFFTVEFIKKDGSVRVINGRLGVKKYLKGGESKLDANKYITIFDMALKQYRAINRATILSVKGL